MKLWRVAGVAALAVCMLGWAVTDSLATKPHKRTGFAVGFGLGGGIARWDWVGDEVDDDPKEWLAAGHARLGRALRDDVVLGLEASVWTKEYDVVASDLDIGSATTTFGAVTLAATWFPGNQGFFVRGGVGVASATVELDLAIVELDDSDTGVAWLGAAGYEWRLSDKLAMGPSVALLFLGVDGDVARDIVVIDGVIEFNWYW